MIKPLKKKIKKKLLSRFLFDYTIDVCDSSSFSDLASMTSGINAADICLAARHFNQRTHTIQKRH